MSDRTLIPPHACILRFYTQIERSRPPIWRVFDIPGSATFWDLHCALTDVYGWNDSHLHQFTVQVADGQDPMAFALGWAKPRTVTIGLPEETNDIANYAAGYEWSRRRLDTDEDEESEQNETPVEAHAQGQEDEDDEADDDEGGSFWFPGQPENDDRVIPGWSVHVADLLVLDSPSLRPHTGVIHYLYDFGDSWHCQVRLLEILLPEFKGHEDEWDDEEGAQSFQPEFAVTYPRCIAGERAGPPDDFGGIGTFNAYVSRKLAAENREEKTEWLRECFPGWKATKFDPESVVFSDPVARLAYAHCAPGPFGRPQAPPRLDLQELMRSLHLPVKVSMDEALM